MRTENLLEPGKDYAPAKIFISTVGTMLCDALSFVAIQEEARGTMFVFNISMTRSGNYQYAKHLFKGENSRFVIETNTGCRLKSKYLRLETNDLKGRLYILAPEIVSFDAAQEWLQGS